jgi:hypothetical protein
VSGSIELSESYETGVATFAAFQSALGFPCLLSFWDLGVDDLDGSESDRGQRFSFM